LGPILGDIFSTKDNRGVATGGACEAGPSL